MDTEEAREIENLLAFANDPGTIRERLAAEHKAADGLNWDTPQGCPCAACRVERGDR